MVNYADAPVLKVAANQILNFRQILLLTREARFSYITEIIEPGCYATG